MDATPAAPPANPARGGALTLLAVLPDGGSGAAWEGADPAQSVRLVAEGGLAALVAPAPPTGEDGDAERVAARHWEVHRALLKGDVAPAPVGVVFGGEGEVRAFLTESSAGLRGALDRVAGRWEFRLHVSVVETGFPRQMALDLATHIYAELRRISAAAVTLPGLHERVLSAAFLVDRAASHAFQDRREVLARLNSALELDLTGPWPPYDFVHMRPPPPVPV